MMNMPLPCHCYIIFGLKKPFDTLLTRKGNLLNMDKTSFVLCIQLFGKCRWFIYWPDPSLCYMPLKLSSLCLLCCPLQVKCYHRRVQAADRDTVFRLQFHTCTVHGSQLWFGKGELDEACTGKHVYWL